jgi:hypothetical protein
MFVARDGAQVMADVAEVMEKGVAKTDKTPSIVPAEPAVAPAAMPTVAPALFSCG